jgi:predicted RNA methylase
MMLDARHVLGQWLTPAAVADLVVALVGRCDGARVLDPACGDGALLARAGGDAIGIEIDPAMAARSRRALPGARIIVGDVLDDAVASRIEAPDVVVGNPPWVRSDRADRSTKRRRADALRADVRSLSAADATTIAARGDLAVFILLRSLRLVRPRGRVVFVLSSALLDTDVADHVWRVVESLATVRSIVAAPAERWFGEAAVNAMIVTLDRHSPGFPIDRDVSSVAVARLRIDTATAAARIAAGASLDDVADVRRVATGPRGWAAALRAPPAWFDFADVAGHALVPLDQLATIRRGATTGGNRFFYLHRADAVARRIEPAVLSPVVRSPYNGAPSTIAIDPSSTPIVAITAPADADLRRLPHLARWIAANADLAERPSLSRVTHPWWHLPTRPARLFVAKAYGPRFIQRLAPAPMLGDQRVYVIEPRPGVDLNALAAVLNATPTALALESLGRASMGHGALEWTTRDLATLPILDVRTADIATRTALATALAAIAPREIRHVADEHGRPDRAALDGAALRLASATAPLLPAMWSALLSSVKLRDRWLLPTA